MTETKTCPKCGTALPENAPAGICPKCLMQAGLASERDAESSPRLNPTTHASGFVPPEPEDLAKHFPQLEILEQLGKGGMGAVYKARQPGLDRLAAVKILPPEVGADPAFAERFTREARALAKLSHQNIVSVFDSGVTPSRSRGSLTPTSPLSAATFPWRGK
jgi:serine/threonine protein kinase